jgi:hypothetical protein
MRAKSVTILAVVLTPWGDAVAYQEPTTKTSKTSKNQGHSDDWHAVSELLQKSDTLLAIRFLQSNRIRSRKAAYL